MSLRDIRSKTRISLGQEQARIAQEFQTLGLILKKAFGEDEKKPQKAPDGRPKNEPRNVDEAEAQLKKVLGG